MAEIQMDVFHSSADPVGKKLTHAEVFLQGATKKKLLNNNVSFAMGRPCRLRTLHCLDSGNISVFLGSLQELLVLTPVGGILIVASRFEQPDRAIMKGEQVFLLWCIERKGEKSGRRHKGANRCARKRGGPV